MLPRLLRSAPSARSLPSAPPRRWNPAGTGLSGLAFPFPVFMLDNATTASAQQRAQYNADRVGWAGGRGFLASCAPAPLLLGRPAVPPSCAVRLLPRSSAAMFAPLRWLPQGCVPSLPPYAGAAPPQASQLQRWPPPAHLPACPPALLRAGHGRRSEYRPHAADHGCVRQLQLLPGGPGLPAAGRAQRGGGAAGAAQRHGVAGVVGRLCPLGDQRLGVK